MHSGGHFIPDSWAPELKRFADDIDAHVREIASRLGVAAHLDIDFPSHRADRAHVDIAGHELDELVRRLAGEPIAFSLAADGTWSAMSLTGEYSVAGETLDELVDELLAVLPT